MLRVYRILTFFLFPLFLILIYLRVILNKEDILRYKEKIFSSSFKPNRNNDRKLIWFHASSIGELLSILPLIKEIKNSDRTINFLITTVTLSSAQLLEKRLDKYQDITHRYFPLDTKNLAEKFLDMWKPDLACFVDSEIWPNFLFEIKKRKIPLSLINGRITKKTFNRWKIFPFFSKQVFDNFDLCLASSEESKSNLSELNVKNLKHIGNLKFSVKNKIEKFDAQNIKILDNFKVWCNSSTHKGEELIVLKAHSEIKRIYNNVLTIIVPRHINRVNYIKNLSDKCKLNCQILNDNETIDKDVEILIINSFGVLSKYYAYCKSIFIGKSLIKKLELVGGQNPIEAAKAGCKIFHGPYVYNFKEIYSLLNSYGFAEEVNNEKDLSRKIIQNFQNQERVEKKQIDLLNIYGESILKQTVVELNYLMKIDEHS
jgi:3-deoxy-D-manno-octulosonic-acid transferase